MSRIGAGSESRVPILDQFGDVIRIPDLVVRVIGTARVVVECDADVVFLRQFLKDVDGIDRFGRNRPHSHCLGELEHLPSLILIGRDTDHSVVDGNQSMFIELRLQLGDDFLGLVVSDLEVAFVRAESLAGIKLNDLATGLGGLLDRLERREAVERVGLAANGKATDLGIIRDLRLSLRRGAHHQDDRRHHVPAREGRVADHDSSSCTVRNSDSDQRVFARRSGDSGLEWATVPDRSIVMTIARQCSLPLRE